MQKGKKTVISYLRLPLLILLAAIVGINVYTWNASRVAGTAVPMPFGVGVSVVLSGSMEPALSVGDLLIVWESDDYAVGDTVVYQDGRSAVVHRIIAIDGDQITAKGDANNTPDEPFPRARICGKVILAIPVIGYLISVIKTPIGTVLLLALAVWLLNSSYKKEQKQDDDRLEQIRAEIEQLKAEKQKKD